MRPARETLRSASLRSRARGRLRASRSVRRRTWFGPELQFTPTASTSRPASSRPTSAAPRPSIVRSSSANVIIAMIGRSGASSRAADAAICTSLIDGIVSITRRSTPDPTSASICSLNAVRASASTTRPIGASTTPSGPTEPATQTSVPATASRAIAAAAALTSPPVHPARARRGETGSPRTCSSRSRRLRRPRTGARAAATISGAVMLSPSNPCPEPDCRCWSTVPVAPSNNGRAATRAVEIDSG